MGKHLSMHSVRNQRSMEPNYAEVCKLTVYARTTISISIQFHVFVTGKIQYIQYFKVSYLKYLGFCNG